MMGRPGEVKGGVQGEGEGGQAPSCSPMAPPCAPCTASPARYGPEPMISTSLLKAASSYISGCCDDLQFRSQCSGKEHKHVEMLSAESKVQMHGQLLMPAANLWTGLWGEGKLEL